MNNPKDEFNQWFNDLLLASPAGPAREALHACKTTLYVEWLRQAKERA